VALELRAYIIADARKRGTPINRRSGKLPAVNDQCDVAMSQWQRINDELALILYRSILLRRAISEILDGLSPNSDSDE